ncbi:growth hormone secretagogue receptor type 1-like [Oculina patagonica]
MMNSTDKYNNGSADHHSENEDNPTLETIVIINCVLNAPLMLISILGNALVLAAIIRTPSIRTTSMIMLCSLAVSDLLVGFLAQPLYIAKDLTEDRFLTRVWSIGGDSLIVVSLLTITAITVDRFLALHYHMRYATLVTESRVKYTLVTIWLFSFLVSGFHFLNTGIQHLILGVLIIICLIISTFSYIRIYLVVRRHQLQMRAQQRAVQSSNAENNSVRLKRSAMNTFVFYIALIICYFPMYFILTREGISGKIWYTDWRLFATTLVFSNSSINPFLYCWRIRELRTAVVKTARQMLCKQTEEN